MFIKIPTINFHIIIDKLFYLPQARAIITKTFEFLYCIDLETNSPTFTAIYNVRNVRKT